LTAPVARSLLDGAGEPVFVAGYPSAFATEVLRLLVEYPPGAPDPLGPWLVVCRADRAAVGLLSCVRTDDPAAVTVGYEVADVCAGQGYATEALQRLVEHLLGLPGVREVRADTTAVHGASRRVMEKAGLRWSHDEVRRVDGGHERFVHYTVRAPATGR
jgi:RimJ/RimL family protein N-acetyltransferase